MARRLSTIAKYINENVEGLTASLEKSYTNTDRKVGRLRTPGKGRRGFKIIIRDDDGFVQLSHDSSGTYRTNQEVERWLEAYERTQYLKNHTAKEVLWTMDNCLDGWDLDDVLTNLQEVKKDAEDRGAVQVKLSDEPDGYGHYVLNVVAWIPEKEVASGEFEED